MTTVGDNRVALQKYSAFLFRSAACHGCQDDSVWPQPYSGGCSVNNTHINTQGKESSKNFEKIDSVGKGGQQHKFGLVFISKKNNA
jgi:hypothetical protein